MPVSAVAAELVVYETQLRRWMRQSGTKGAVLAWRPITQTQTQVPAPADLAAENARLKRALRKAKTERDILKRASLLFGADSR